MFDLLIPVLVTGIQPDQVLGLKERFPRRRRGAALISVTSTEMRVRRDCSPQRCFPDRAVGKMACIRANGSCRDTPPPNLLVPVKGTGTRAAETRRRQ
ncbi:hypothetical protein DA102_008455 [Sinorhizobium meliloti]|nr:hypothetical protein C3L21_11405 [Sinorhizobium meliloti]RMC67661.1 hypothetical protein EBB04_11740 [Sinorhizobium meliloti]RMI22489.1 hypothetical protein DA102_008455 [Sinorhizobium meliloti]